MTNILATEGRPDFLTLYGFTMQNWMDLQRALVAHPQTHVVVKIKGNAYGSIYEIQCSIKSPDRSNPCIRSFWIIDSANPNPRFVTAYP